MESGVTNSLRLPKNASIALQSFNEALEMVQELLLLEAKYQLPPRLKDQKAIQGLRGGSSVLMVAAFEYFIRQCLEEHIKLILSYHPKLNFNKLPEKMRVYNTVKTLEQAMKGSPYEPNSTKAQRLPNIEKACKIIVGEILNPIVFCDTKSNPNSSNLKEMFKNLGIDNIFDSLKTKFDKKWGKPTPSTFLNDKLDEIINRRHIIAHTANALNVSRSDLKESIKFLFVFSVVIDQELGHHIRSIISQAG